MVGAISSSDPTGRSDVFLDASNYPNPDEGLMRGNLYSDTPGETYFFVLSNGHLSYYESQTATDEGDVPLGMLRLDDIKAARATKRMHKEYAISITTANLHFTRSMSASASQLNITDAPASPARASSGLATSPASVGTGSNKLDSSHKMDGASTMQRRTSVWSWMRQLFVDETGDNARTDSQEELSETTLVLVAKTPFEADAWVSAIREAKQALVSAAGEQQWGHVVALSGAGRDVNIKEDGNQRTALHYAAGYGEVDTAGKLMQAGANVNARDRAGMTPLGWACLKGHLELTQLLLKYNADPLIKAHSGVLVGKTAITLARLHGSQNHGASRKGAELVHMLLMHCGAACFQVHHMLGQGGFGKVLAVSRADSGEKFAMKTILKQGSNNPITNRKMVQQARVERQILRRMTHPFVIDLHCAFQTHDKLLLVLEICPGGDLKSHLSRCGRFPPEVAAFTASQVLLALDYLHSQNIVHRDIKLENVLLDGKGYVRLTDFNVAKMMEERRTFSMKGTLFCMAPEVILKKGHDTAADFWSYGVFIFELLTGGPPFYSSDKQELKRQILGMDPRRYNLSFPPDMPTACRMFLSQLLVRDPRLRLGARRSDVSIMKAHPFFGRLDWELLLRKEIPSPLVQSVELVAQARQAKQQRQALESADHEMVPSYLSQQSCLVEDWDYVAGGPGLNTQRLVAVESQA